MNVHLLSMQECRTILRERIDSGKWWTLPWVSAAATETSALIEDTLYAGEGSADFEIFTLTLPGCSAVSTARKRRAGPAKLAKLFGHRDVAYLRTHDVLLPLDGRDDPVARDGIAAFFRWILGDDGWDAAPLPPASPDAR